MYTIFFEAFEWDEDGSNCDPNKSGKVCYCSQKYPVYMLVSGAEVDCGICDVDGRLCDYLRVILVLAFACSHFATTSTTVGFSFLHERHISMVGVRVIPALKQKTQLLAPTCTRLASAWMNTHPDLLLVEHSLRSFFSQAYCKSLRCSCWCVG